jgi:hypothetical protein
MHCVFRSHSGKTDCHERQHVPNRDRAAPLISEISDLRRIDHFTLIAGLKRIMLRTSQNTSAAGAKSYSTADYYTERQELNGQRRGEGARRLGLFGDIQKQHWDDARPAKRGRVSFAELQQSRR